MMSFGKRIILALGLGSMALGVPAALAQPGQNRDWHRQDRNWQDRSENDRSVQYRRDIDRNRVVDGNWRSNDRDHRNWRNYDYNRYERGQRSYYADNYYRSGYRPVRVTRNTRVYRGNNGNYYCRRNDGTTGLIVGAALGGVVGNQLDRGGSRLLGTLLGAGGGALLGREIDRGGVSCR